MSVQVLVGKPVEQTAVVLVRAGLGGEVEDASLGLAELRRIIPGLQADFFQRFHRGLLIKEE